MFCIQSISAASLSQLTSAQHIHSISSLITGELLSLCFILHYKKHSRACVGESKSRFFHTFGFKTLTSAAFQTRERLENLQNNSRCSPTLSLK